MKIIETLMIVGFCGCLLGCYQQNKDPIFKQGQEITYEVPPFCSLVCTGNGKINGLLRTTNGYAYSIYTESGNGACPDLTLDEKDIKAK